MLAEEYISIVEKLVAILEKIDNLQIIMPDRLKEINADDGKETTVYIVLNFSKGTNGDYLKSEECQILTP